MRFVLPRLLGMCALLQALFIAPTVSAEPAAPAAAKRPEGVAAKNATPVPGGTATPAAGQTIRMAIASLLERQARFRKFDDDGAPKLVKAAIAGPIQRTALFSGKIATVYCVEADLIMTKHVLWVSQTALSANVTFTVGDDGKQRIGGIVKNVRFRSTTCGDAPFAPFPELEQLRDRRRHELGKADN